MATGSVVKASGGSVDSVGAATAADAVPVAVGWAPEGAVATAVVVGAAVSAVACAGGGRVLSTYKTTTPPSTRTLSATSRINKGMRDRSASCAALFGLGLGCATFAGAALAGTGGGCALAGVGGGGLSWPGEAAGGEGVLEDGEGFRLRIVGTR